MKKHSSFSVGKNHGYLGHFAQPKVLRAGHNTGPSLTLTPSGRVMVSRKRSNTNVTLDSLARGNVRRAIAGGGALGQSVAAERPVLAAKMAARQMGQSPTAVRAAGRMARNDPNSAYSERMVRRRS